jgi:hypothetical protein
MQTTPCRGGWLLQPCCCLYAVLRWRPCLIADSTSDESIRESFTQKDNAQLERYKGPSHFSPVSLFLAPTTPLTTCVSDAGAKKQQQQHFGWVGGCDTQ